MIDKHEFVPITNSKICNICYRPKLHELHLDNLKSEDISASKLPSRNEMEDHAKQNGIEEVTSNNVKIVPEIDAQLSLSVVTDNVDHYGIKDKTDPRAPEGNKPDCYGHICPDCGIFWTHSYKCWPDPKIKESMYCPIHFSQATADMNRHHDIDALDAIASNAPNLRELKEAALQHESFVVLEASKSPDFEVWFDLHLRDLRSKINLFNAQISGASAGRQKLRAMATDKLTPDEIQQYRKNASRSKEKVVEKKDKKSKKEYQDTLKSLISMLSRKMPVEKATKVATANLNEMYKEEGKDIPECD